MDHEAGDDAVEDGAVVEALFGEGDEVVVGVGSDVVGEAGLDDAFFGFDGGVFEGDDVGDGGGELGEGAFAVGIGEGAELVLGAGEVLFAAAGVVEFFDDERLCVFPGEDVGAALFDLGEEGGDVDGSVVAHFDGERSGGGFEFFAAEGVEGELGKAVVVDDFAGVGGGEPLFDFCSAEADLFEGLFAFFAAGFLEFDEDGLIGLGVEFDGSYDGGVEGSGGGAEGEKSGGEFHHGLVLTLRLGGF